MSTRGTWIAATGRARRGAALIVALGFVALLSLMITGMIGTLHDRLIESEQRDQRGALRADAESALAVIMARLAVFRSDGNGIYLNENDLMALEMDPLAGWKGVSGAEVTVLLDDESAYFGVNSTNTEMLRGLFEDLGLGEGRSRELADALVDWTDADNNVRARGAEIEVYGRPGYPANRPVRSFDELRKIKGFDDAFFEMDGTPNENGRRLASVISFLDTGAGPNVNTASEQLLTMISSRSGGDVGAIVSSRTTLNLDDPVEHGGVYNNAGELAAIEPPAELVSRLTYASRGLRVTIFVRKGELSYVLDALVGVNPAGTAVPVAVLKRADEALLAPPRLVSGIRMTDAL